MENAESEFGGPDARSLIQTLADVEALADADELLKFMDGAIKIDKALLHVAIGLRYEATFLPIGQRIETSESGDIDWSSVRRLKLLSLVRTHD